MSLAAVSTLRNHTDSPTDELLHLGQTLIDRGVARMRSLYFRRVNGLTHRTVTLTVGNHPFMLRLVDADQAVTCRCVHADGSSDLVATTAGSLASAVSAIESYLSLHAVTHAA